MTKELGKIAEVKFGLGGYDNCMMGVSFVLDMNGSSSSVQDFWGMSARAMLEKPYLTESVVAEIYRRITTTMLEAKANSLEDLRGKPIEVTLEGNVLKSWRILTEVL